MEQGFSISDTEQDDPLLKLGETLSRPPVQFLLLVVATLAVYAHTLDVPFYFDDYSSIRDNPAIRDLGNLGNFWNYASARVIGYLSFVLNFALGEYAVVVYHVFNILVHVLAVFAVF
ncbi:MAG: hypothetical protein WD601_08810, partial [Pseudohongiellaceae bacterium]